MAAKVRPLLHPGGEVQRREGYTLAALVACGVQGAVLVLRLMAPPHVLVWEALYGGLICGLAALLLHSPRVPLPWVERGVLAAAGAGFALKLYGACLSEVFSPGLSLGVVLLAAALFCTLESVWAAWLTAALYVVFALLALAYGGEGMPLIELALTLALLGGLCLSLKQKSAEHAQKALFGRVTVTDPLTGVGNRRAMYGELHRAMAELPGGRDFAVVLVDLDYFKQINDRYSHEVGDQVLEQVALALQLGMRAGDFVARWGGDEFLLLLPGVDERAAKAEAYLLWREVRWLGVPGLPKVTASLGVAMGSAAGSVEELLQLADERLSVAKSSGRDRICLPEKPLPNFF